LTPPLPVRSGIDAFWTFDAAISFRLSKRCGFVSVVATNLFDEQFNFFEVDFDNPTIQPTRIGLSFLAFGVHPPYTTCV